MTDVEHLVANGLDFLEAALKQLSTEPKHSVINFYSAVEILLKAPLLADHWSLIVADEKSLDKKRYESGDFQSIGFSTICTRLEKALEKPLPEVARKALDKIRKHRNRIVHFYHSGLIDGDVNQIREEQGEAWFALNQYIQANFTKELADCKRRIISFDSRLSVTDYYAKAKFDDLKPKLTALIAKGGIVIDCPSCSMQSLEVSVPYPAIPELKLTCCHVCSHQRNIIEAPCPNCQALIEIEEPAEAASCQQCNKKNFSEDEIYALLDQSTNDHHNYFDAETPADCYTCSSVGTVCVYKNGYLCTRCLCYFTQLFNCGYCGQSCTELDEESSYRGCLQCDGAADRYAND